MYSKSTLMILNALISQEFAVKSPRTKKKQNNGIQYNFSLLRKRDSQGVTNDDKFLHDCPCHVLVWGGGRGWGMEGTITIIKVIIINIFS